MCSKVYLLKKEMDLNIRSRRYFSEQENNIENKIQKGNLVNCKDYAKETNNYCLSKQGCIDKCVLERYQLKHPKKYPLLVIFENEIEKNPEKKEYSFSPKREKTITLDCRKKYHIPDCKYSVYNRDTKQISLKKPDQKSLNISVLENEFDYFINTNHALDKLLFDFITIYSILLGKS